VQSLIREVTYNTLARRDRKSRHLAAARFFESLETDELAGGLAGQYLAAHANADGPEETAALAAQARVALRAAADRAAALGSPDQAFGFLRDALALAVDKADEAELALRAGEAASSGGRYSDAEPLLRRALDMFTAAADEGGSDRAVTALATNLIEGARFTEAIELLEPVLANVERFEGRPDLIGAGGQLARAHMLQQEPSRAIDAADRVLPAAETGDLSHLVADILITKGTALIMARRAREGLALVTSGGELGEALNNDKVTLRALINQSFALAWVSQRLAYEGARKGLAMSRRFGHRGFEMNLALNSVYAGIHVGEWDWAAAEATSALETEFEAIDRLGVMIMAVTIRSLRGEARDEEIAEVRAAEVAEVALRQEIERARGLDEIANGRLSEAGRRFDANRQSAGDIDDHLWSARVATWRRDGSTLASALEALRTSGRHGEMSVALALEIEASLAGLGGATAEALAKFEEARGAWRRLGLPWDEALLGIDMASVLDPALPEVQEAVSRSRAILAGLGARPFLEILDAAAGRGGMTNGRAPAAGDAQPIPAAETEVAAS
jgi:tetratricopeptide (TPR) repeat protein